MIESWFPTLIYYDFLSDIDNNLLSKRAYQMRDESGSRVTTQWECDTWNSLHSNCFKGDEIDDIINKLIETAILHVEQYASEYNADLHNYKVVCRDFWFNIAEPTNYQEYHQHPNNHFSAVYYLDAQPDSGNIIFKSMDSITSSITIPELGRTDNVFNGSINKCSYEPQPGLILIFKSNLLHMVERNYSNKDRISIAMNFIMELK